MEVGTQSNVFKAHVLIIYNTGYGVNELNKITHTAHLVKIYFMLSIENMKIIRIIRPSEMSKRNSTYINLSHEV